MSFFSCVLIFLHLRTIMENPRNVHVNMAIEPDNDESSSSTRVVDPILMDIFYEVDSHIPPQIVLSPSFG